MKPLILALALFCSPFIDTSIVLAQEASNKQIIGYLPNWAAYRRNRLFNPFTIDYSRYTILDYSFFSPDENGKIISCDPFADKLLLKAEPNVVQLAHAKGVKVMVSLGGWSLSKNFSGIAADPVKRKYFAEQCVELLNYHDFDGIDIDWEWPTFVGNNGTPQDTENFTLLLREIRAAIDAYGESVGAKMLLTAAVGAAPNHYAAINWKEVCEILDYVNLMSYATNGVWSERAGHNSPLSLPADSVGGTCTMSSVQMIHEEFGVPMNKLNVGLPFYGHAMLFKKGEAALYSDKLLGVADTAGVFRVTKGSPSYYDILEKINEFDQFWDEDAQVPYLLNKDRSVFVTYDDERSIRLKAEYAMSVDAAGVIIWDVSHDYVETRPNSGTIKGTPLADVVCEVLKHDPKALKKIKKKKVKK